ncbi:MAG: SH3 domain-containing protein [Blautia sp.]|nr:SH3 domain-containing protein [Blautia sp.]
MKIRHALLSLAIGAAFFALPVCAETITTADGILSIETPDSSWRQITDPNYWISLTDGANIISIAHCSNGASLPSVEVANSSYNGVFHAFLSTRNEVFIIKGEAARVEDMQKIMTAIGSVRILQYNTLTALSTSSASSMDSIGLRPVGSTYYVDADLLVVRTGCSTDDRELGTLSYGDSVYVVSAVTKDGADFGWYQIEYNEGVAYTSSAFLVPEPPAGTENDSGSQDSQPKISTEGLPSFTLNLGGGAGTVTIYQNANGIWTDDTGLPFFNNDNGTWSDAKGNTLYNSHSEIISVNGENVMIYEQPDGSWTDENGLAADPPAVTIAFDDGGEGGYVDDTGSGEEGYVDDTGSGEADYVDDTAVAEAEFIDDTAAADGYVDDTVIAE